MGAVALPPLAHMLDGLWKRFAVVHGRLGRLVIDCHACQHLWKLRIIEYEAKGSSRWPVSHRHGSTIECIFEVSMTCCL